MRPRWRLPDADDVLLDTATAAHAMEVEPATIRDWRRRGLLEPAGGSARRPLWRMSDLLRAKRAPKPRHAEHGSELTF